MRITLERIVLECAKADIGSQHDVAAVVNAANAYRRYLTTTLGTKAWHEAD